jgi:hypothetical protein
MKTLRLQKILTAMICTLLLLPITACSEDNEEELEDPAVKEFVRVYYRVQLAQAWYDLYDIEIEYTDATGAQNSKTITKDALYDQTVDSSLAADQFSFKVVAKPKATTPEIEDNVAYTLDYNCEMYIYKYEDGATDVTPIYRNAKSNTMNSGGSALRAQLTKERSLFNYSYSMSK